MASMESGVPRLTKVQAFRIFKGLVFLILMFNLFYYLYEDVTAYIYLADDSSWLDAVESFAVTIDYVAWMLLIVLFEIETSAQTRNRLHGAQKWTIAGLTAACYVVLVYAAYGYAASLANSYHFEPIASDSVCGLAEKKFAYMSLEGRPVELTAENCEAFAGEAVFKSPGDNVIATHGNLLAFRKLGWVDVFNATAWLLVVLLFQIGVMLSQANRLTKRRLLALEVAKATAYLVLLVCAVYWTIYSAFIDSWDAWLWLVAFLLIDLNLLGLDDGAASTVDESVSA